MPYITEKTRDELDLERRADSAGELTYELQQTISNYLVDNHLEYQTIAEVLGSIEGAKLDFIERVVKPYEKKKRKQNGDVWPQEMTK